MADEASAVSDLLDAYRQGDETALEKLVPLVYDDLRLLARRQRRRLPPGQTLNTTALVHEAYLKLRDHAGAGWQDRAHFLAVASRAMRQILVDYARRRGARKRGGGATALPLDDRDAAVERDADRILALDEALEALGRLDPRLPRVVECRFFGGLTDEETGEALGISTRTVQRDWLRARAWLREEDAGLWRLDEYKGLPVDHG